MLPVEQTLRDRPRILIISRDFRLGSKYAASSRKETSMIKSKYLTATLAALTVVGSAGLVYAQTSQTPASGNQPSASGQTPVQSTDTMNQDRNTMGQGTNNQGTGSMNQDLAARADRN